MLVMMVSIGGAGFVMGERFLKPVEQIGPVYSWSGVSCFVGTVMIAFSAMLMRFGTIPPETAY